MHKYGISQGDFYSSFLFYEFGVVIVTFTMKTYLFSSAPEPTLAALRKKQTRALKQQTVPRLHSCFNVGFKLSLMPTDGIDN